MAGDVGGALVAVVLLAGLGLYVLIESLNNGLYGGTPTKVTFVDRAVGVVEPSSLGLTGEVLLTSEHSLGLGVVPLADTSRMSSILVGAVSVDSIGPGGRYALAWASRRWELVRLSDLHVVAAIEGGRPSFLDADRLVAISEADGCSRREARIIDLRDRTQQEVKLSGGKARLTPVATDRGQVVAQRLTEGDSACGTAGYARVDLATGKIRTVATEGAVVAVVDGYVWLTDLVETKVYGPTGLASSSSGRVMAVAAGDRVVYVDDPWPRSPVTVPVPVRLRLAAPTGPQPDDPAGDELPGPGDMSVVADGSRLLVAHRSTDPAKAASTKATSLCSLPTLRCRVVLDSADVRSAAVGIVPTTALMQQGP